MDKELKKILKKSAKKLQKVKGISAERKQYLFTCCLNNLIQIDFKTEGDQEIIEFTETSGIELTDKEAKFVVDIMFHFMEMGSYKLQKNPEKYKHHFEKFKKENEKTK